MKCSDFSVSHGDTAEPILESQILNMGVGPQVTTLMGKMMIHQRIEGFCSLVSVKALSVAWVILLKHC